LPGGETRQVAGRDTYYSDTVASLERLAAEADEDVARADARILALIDEVNAASQDLNATESEAREAMTNPLERIKDGIVGGVSEGANSVTDVRNRAKVRAMRRLEDAKANLDREQDYRARRAEAADFYRDRARRIQNFLENDPWNGRARSDVNGM
jgi:ElaB/YqjD/DUF883 family membrane-anchored ribosome-binding protein